MLNSDNFPVFIVPECRLTILEKKVLEETLKSALWVLHHIAKEPGGLIMLILRNQSSKEGSLYFSGIKSLLLLQLAPF